jgi:hypothetical protein
VREVRFWARDFKGRQPFSFHIGLNKLVRCSADNREMPSEISSEKHLIAESPVETRVWTQFGHFEQGTNSSNRSSSQKDPLGMALFRRVFRERGGQYEPCVGNHQLFPPLHARPKAQYSPSIFSNRHATDPRVPAIILLSPSPQICFMNIEFEWNQHFWFSHSDPIFSQFALTFPQFSQAFVSVCHYILEISDQAFHARIIGMLV